ncbi:hypothetical protein GNP80_04330 [Aliivibrio fischeri]|nr:hypothetical protein [Aliivibrio fischeri]
MGNLSNQDLLYVTGSIRPQDEIKKNDACFRAGFLGSKIQVQPYSQQEMQLLEAGLFKKLPVYDRVLNRKSKHVTEVEIATEHFEKLNRPPEHVREAAARIAEDYRLVNGRKSPTQKMDSRKWDIRNTLRVLGRGTPYPIELVSTESHFNQDVLYGSTGQSTAAILHEKGKRNDDESKLAPVSFQVQHREWSGQYRGQVVTQTPVSNAPDANAGERFSEKLTSRSVSKIFESAAYTSTCHGGFTTFLTLTFNKEQRLRIFGGLADPSDVNSIGAHHPVRFRRNMVTYKSSEFVKRTESPVCNIGGAYTSIAIDGQIPKLMNASGDIAGDYCLLSQKPKAEFTIDKTLETTVGKEVSRLLDGLKKMYQRGWLADHTVQTDKHSHAKYSDLTHEQVPPHFKSIPTEFGPSFMKDDFHYIWVAECPANEDGEPNPHVHVLLRWTVEPHLFSAWAKRFEKIWGHGFAKLERIREPKAAGSYIIKAVGYAAKGDNAEQGLIRGNRYNIAKCSRAPAWECIASFEADNITAIIKELGYRLERWKKPLERTLNRLSYQKRQTIKAKATAIKKGEPEDKLKKMQSRIIRLEKQALNVKKEMKSRQVHVSTANNFSISFDGKEARDKLDDFLMWAAGARGWGMDCRDMDLSELKNEADGFYHDRFIQFKDKQAYWQAVLNDPIPIETHDENELSYWKSFTADYLEGRLTPMLR